MKELNIDFKNISRIVVESLANRYLTDVNAFHFNFLEKSKRPVDKCHQTCVRVYWLFSYLC